MDQPTFRELAKMIDHSILQPTANDDDLENGFKVALEYDVASICIKPYAVPRGKKALAGSTVVVSTVIGFPHGGHTTAIKVAEAERAMDDGAVEMIGEERAARAALLPIRAKHEVIDDQLAFAAKQLGQR